MESQESVYVNLQEQRGIRGKAEHQGPEKTKTRAVGTRAVGTRAVGTKAVGTRAVGTGSEVEEESETPSPLKAVAVCLGLLCFLLLTAVIAVGVKYNFELSRELANHTAEKHQLLARYQNLTDDRDQLQTSLKEAAVELRRTLDDIGVCPDGWKRFGCSCYFLSPTTTTWDHSRQQCMNQGAHLVIITRQEEMIFLNQLGAHLMFWIGLSKPAGGASWTWTDGRHLGTTYWKHTQIYNFYSKTQECAAFNSFQAELSLDSWSQETCTRYLQWVCEKEAVPSGQNV